MRAETSTPTRKRPDSGTGGGIGDAWRVIVLNDNHNPFEGVAFALAATIPGVSYEQGLLFADRITGELTIPARTASYADFPDDLHPRLSTALKSRGVHRLYRHQCAAWDSVARGEEKRRRVERCGQADPDF